ncbi:hypothetical protein E4U09_000747, partial [Claviceps aff. purpurea]
MPPLGEIDPNVQRPRLPAKRGPRKMQHIDRLYQIPKRITRIERPIPTAKEIR